MKIIPIDRISHLSVGVTVTKPMYVVVWIDDGDIGFQGLFDYISTAEMHCRECNRLYGDYNLKFEVYEVIPEGV